MSASVCNDIKQLQKVNKNIRRLSEELQHKKHLVSGFASSLPQLSNFIIETQSKQFSAPSPGTIHLDKVAQDPSFYPWLSSTMHQGSIWARVVVWGQKNHRGPGSSGVMWVPISPEPLEPLRRLS